MEEELYIGDTLMPPFLDMRGDPLLELPEPDPAEDSEEPPENSLNLPGTTSRDTLSMALPD
jgi:hypothetical protein